MILRTRVRRCKYDRYGWPTDELYWDEWEVLDSELPPAKVESALKFWRDLNAYAVSERGPTNTLREFEVI